MEDVRSSKAVRLQEREAGPDRRLHPRVPANLPVLIMAAGRIVVGRTRDASEGGLAVSVTTPLPELPSDVTIAVRLPTHGWTELEGHIVRREPDESSLGLLGIRLRTEDAPAAARERTGPRAPGSARLRPCRPPSQEHSATAFDAELRALATLVYEQALNEPQGKPLRSLVMWSNHLRAELGVESEEPTSYRDFLRGLAALHRCTGRPRPRRKSGSAA